MTSSVTSKTGHQWYAIQVRSRHEKVVRHQLARKRVDAFLPTVTRRVARKKRTIEWPLFPGYCFAYFDSAHALPILTCAGVLGIVSFGRVPAAIPQHELDGVRLLVDSCLPYDPCPLLQEGSVVEVVRGPLRGIVGRLLRSTLPRTSLVLSVELIGRGARVEVDATDVVPLATQGEPHHERPGYATL